MEALLVNELPSGTGWQYEPKWDGFRCLVFRDGGEVFLQSKAGQPLSRYFPDIVEEVQSIRCRRFALDSEIVIPVVGILSFNDLLMRIHPAESRVRKLAAQFPAAILVFDLLVDDKGARITEQPLSTRRGILEKFNCRYLVPVRIKHTCFSSSFSGAGIFSSPRARQSLSGIPQPEITGLALPETPWSRNCSPSGQPGREWNHVFWKEYPPAMTCGEIMTRSVV
jgi:hypothetical protein